MKIKSGFTIVELVVVVVIIGILAAMALPQYTKTVERSRQSEAMTNLAAIRGAQIRYKLENGTYLGPGSSLITDFSALDIDPPNYNNGIYANGKFFVYNTLNTTVSANNITVASAQRKLPGSGVYGQYWLEINDQGKIYCASTTLDCAGFKSD